MKLYLTISEYDNRNGIAINTEFEDGTPHGEVVEKILDAVSVLYGYDIKEDYGYSSSNT